MLEREVRHVKVGIFIFVAMFVATLIVFMIGSNKKIFESQYTLKCTFANISGLRIGAPVQLAGVQVGVVQNIRFPKDLLQKDIVVVLKLSRKYKERIREDSVGTIDTQGLLGDKFIFISVGSQDQPEIPDGGFIKTKEVVGLFSLAEKGGEILEDVRSAAENLSKFLEDLHGNRGDMKESITSLRNILNEVEKGKGLVHELVYDPKGQAVIADLADSMASLKIVLGEDEKSPDRRAKFKNIAQNINNAAKNLSEITDKINKGQGTLGGLITDPSIYNDIRSIFGKADRNNLFKTVVRQTLEENEKSVLK